MSFFMIKAPCLLFLFSIFFFPFYLHPTQFYHTKTGEEIMNPHTYPKSITDFLNEEHLFILEQIKEYNIFFEIGCATAERALHIVRANCNFYGIDINPDFIARSHFFFLDHGLARRAKSELFSVNNLTVKSWPSSLRVGKKEKVLIYFPFNLIGNLTDLSRIFGNIIEIGYDFAFSTYRINEFVYQERLRYYRNCGCNNLYYTRTKNGDLFTSSDGLYSAAFDEMEIRNTLFSILKEKQKTASITTHDLTGIGYAIFIRNVESSVNLL